MNRRRIVLLSTVAPDRPNGSMMRYGRMVRDALEQHVGGEFCVEEISLAPSQIWLERFPGRVRTLLRYLCIAIKAHRLLPESGDVILHLLDGSHSYLLGTRKRLPAPLVITAHDVIPLLGVRGEMGTSRPGRVGSRIVRRAADNLIRANALVAVSGNTRDDLVRCVGIGADRIHVVHHSMTIPGPLPSARSAPPASRYILHVAGNNTFYKNRQGVVEIFKLIRQSEPIVLKMAGAPPDTALLRKVAESGVASEIEFLANVSENELAVLYRNAAFLLFPSLYEGFGWPPLEAMQQGCPVVCSDVGSLHEVVGGAALMAPASDVTALAECGLSVLRDVGVRNRLVEAGFLNVRRFTSEALAAGLIGAYHAAERAFDNNHIR